MEALNIEKLTKVVAEHQISHIGTDSDHYQAETTYDGCACGWWGPESEHQVHATEKILAVFEETVSELLGQAVSDAEPPNFWNNDYNAGYVEGIVDAETLILRK